MKEKVRKKKDETKSERNSETLRIQTGGNTNKKNAPGGIFPLCKNMLHILPVQADPVREPSAGGQGGQPVRR
jgi:hypothetical protein